MSARRLHTVVRIRRLQEQLASAEVARSRQTFAAAEHAEQAAWGLVAERATPTARDLRSLLDERTKLHGGIVHAHRLEERTIAAHHHADLALDDWREAMQRLDGIERLSDRLASAERAERERLAHNELDDLVVMRWEGDAS